MRYSFQTTLRFRRPFRAFASSDAGVAHQTDGMAAVPDGVLWMTWTHGSLLSFTYLPNTSVRVGAP
jgi:hypothetical protein